MKIKDYIISLYESNIYPTTIRTDSDFNFYENNFNVLLNDGTNINVQVIKYLCVDPTIVEFLDVNQNIVAKAKGFDSVI